MVSTQTLASKPPADPVNFYLRRLSGELNRIKHIHILHDELLSEIKNGNIQFGGHSKLKISGTLDYTSGKRTLRNNKPP